MRKYIWLIMVVLMIFVITLVGCQKPTPTTLPSTVQILTPTDSDQMPLELEQPPVETEQKPTAQILAYPSPDEAYPPPVIVQPVYNPYPGPSDGVSNFLDWSQAEALILKGDVSEVYQTHTLNVTLVLIDGKIFLTVEPEIDEVFKVVERCGDLCKSVIQTTE